MDFSIQYILNAIIFTLLTTVILLFLYIKRKQNYWAQKGVPHVKAESIIFGNLKDVFVNKKSMFDKFARIYRQFENEPYCGFYEFHYPVLMVRDPQLIQLVLTEKFSSFEKTKLVIAENADEIFGENPFIHHGQRWKETRSLLAAGLTPNKVRTLEEISKTISQELISYLDSHPNDIEVYTDLVSRYISEMVANFGWGIRSDGFSSKSVVKEIFDLIAYSSSFTFELMWCHPFLSRLLKLRLFPKKLFNFLLSITEQAASSNDTTKNTQYCFLQHLLNAKEKSRSSGKDIPMPVITGHMATFFFDGYETTARVTSYIIYCLMLYPEMQKKVKEEILCFEGEITIEEVSKLQYMDMFISEVFRVHPILIYLGRICTEKCKLGSLTVEEGTAVIVPISGVHSDPSIYPEPDVFNPEHFTEENKNKRHKYTFFPFGQGHRMCLGMRYAMANIKLLLFCLLKNYDIVSPEEHPVHKLQHNPEVKIIYVNQEPMYVRFKKTA